MNELRETFHRWVRTLALPVRDAEIRIPLDHVPARIRRDAPEVDDPDERERAGEIIEEVSAGLRAWLREYRDELTQRLAIQLRVDGEAARGREDKRYRQRQGEVSALIEQSTLARLTREIEQLRERGRQGQLFDETERLSGYRAVHRGEAGRAHTPPAPLRGDSRPVAARADPHSGPPPARALRHGRQRAGISCGPGDPSAGAACVKQGCSAREGAPAGNGL